MVRYDFVPMAAGSGDLIAKRESEAGGCMTCGANLSQWETGLPIELAAAAVFLDPALLEPLLVRRCRDCGEPYDWDVLILAEEPEEIGVVIARQAELLDALGEMLRRPGMQPGGAADRLGRRFGVKGIYVEDGSEVAGRLRRLCEESGDTLPGAG